MSSELDDAARTLLQLEQQRTASLTRENNRLVIEQVQDQQSITACQKEIRRLQSDIRTLQDKLERSNSKRIVKEISALPTPQQLEEAIVAHHSRVHFDPSSGCFLIPGSPK